MNKTFDCVEMKHKGADKIRKKIAKLNIKQELQFWNEITALLKKKKTQVTEQHKVEV